MCVFCWMDKDDYAGRNLLFHVAEMDVGALTLVASLLKDDSATPYTNTRHVLIYDGDLDIDSEHRKAIRRHPPVQHTDWDVPLDEQVNGDLNFLTEDALIGSTHRGGYSPLMRALMNTPHGSASESVPTRPEEGDCIF
jgi:hypothetical protein